MNNNFINFVEKPSNKRFVDIDGQTFNQLTVLGYAGKINLHKNNHHHYWYVQCDCSLETIKVVESNQLRTGGTRSCGCLQKEITSAHFKKHGMRQTVEYTCYTIAKGRCENINNSKYKNYGGRGIEFRFNNFEEFHAEMSDKPEPKENYSIDRINVNGHYEKGNVRWTTNEDQSKNKRNNRWITFNGQLKIASDWAIEYGLKPKVLFLRLNVLNWCEECAITISVNGGTCRHV